MKRTNVGKVGIALASSFSPALASGGLDSLLSTADPSLEVCVKLRTVSSNWLNTVVTDNAIDAKLTVTGSDAGIAPSLVMGEILQT